MVHFSQKFFPAELFRNYESFPAQRLRRRLAKCLKGSINHLAHFKFPVRRGGNEKEMFAQLISTVGMNCFNESQALALLTF